MPAPIPTRDRDVYFIGAGVSCALGLPNTAMLLDGVVELSRVSPRWQREDLEGRLTRAFQYFYPDADHVGYKPEVVDFFSALRTYLDVGAGLPGGFADAPHLYRSLKLAIAHLLILQTRACRDVLRDGHPFLDEVVQRGKVVITSNWDPLIERYAALRSVPIRLGGTGDDSELVLLKLHGSIDWTLGRDMRRPGTTLGYAMLNERLNPTRPYTPKIPGRDARKNLLVRVRMLENWSKAWSWLTSRTSSPHMVTMARGKAGDLGPLRAIWRDAYGAVSRAQRLEIVGYSMPPDDTEIRTILRAGVQRGRDDLGSVVVRNPTPEVHIRVRQYLDRAVDSDYQGIGAS